MHRRPHARAHLGALLAAMLLTGAACGGGDDAPQPTEASPPTSAATTGTTDAADSTGPTDTPDTADPTDTSGTSDATVAPGGSVTPTGLTLPAIAPVGPACGPGERIAFDHEPTEAEALVEQSWSIHVVDTDGTTLATLFDGQYAYVGQPAWSPDGTRLAVNTTDADGGSALVVARCDGTVEVTMDLLQRTASPIDLPIDGSFPVWSPDGSLIAFTSPDGLFVVDPGNVEQPYTIDIDATVARSRPAWSPDGTTLVVAFEDGDGADLWAVPIDGRGPTQLTTDPAADFQPAWSPDGSLIAFHSDRGGARRVWLMAADGTDQRALTSSDMSAFQPTWSPDGRRLAYVSSTSYEPDTAGDTRIRVIGADGSDDHQLTPADARPHFEGNPTWTS